MAMLKHEASIIVLLVLTSMTHKGLYKAASMKGVAILGETGGVASSVGVVVKRAREMERPIRIHLNGVSFLAELSAPLQDTAVLVSP